ncbi:MAG: hypothetical protein KGJ41_02665 [Rhodospirillales bacterium]|nr:hypothetical protein [Rhodospirillales bacterium]MDE2197899.1 hypothetical protein [Rhodospirillales bacterium]MDE2575535.1 hypothetical protein [Rhodospirillales bacterium]
MHRMNFAMLLALGACSTLPATPGQSVYAMSVSYQGALTTALAYERLPDCAGATAPPLCSRAELRQRIASAVDHADPLVRAAEAAARATNPSATALTNALAAATVAVSQLAALSTTLTVK